MKNKVLKGFKPLKQGKIHLLCPSCGRKQSNMNRCVDDPKEATVLKTECPRCAVDFTEITYLDNDGKEIEGPYESKS